MKWYLIYWDLGEIEEKPSKLHCVFSIDTEAICKKFSSGIYDAENNRHNTSIVRGDNLDYYLQINQQSLSKFKMI